jgi:hypothetical protein
MTFVDLRQMQILGLRRKQYFPADPAWATS